MTTDEIYRAASQLGKREKYQLVNRILASIKDDRRPTPSEDDNVPVMPVYEALYAFADIYERKKGVSFAPNNKFKPVDFKWMKELLWKIEERIVERGTCIVDDTRRLNELRGFLEAVSAMKNQWYFENRFTPYGLCQDFEKIYSNLVTQSDHARRKAAFDYL